MGGVVGDVAALGAKVQRHAAVGRDGQDEQQLLQVGPVVLVVSPGDGEARRIGIRRLLALLIVRSKEGDGGGVIMHLAQFDSESLDDVRRQSQNQRGDIDLGQFVQYGTARRLCGVGGWVGSAPLRFLLCVLCASNEPARGGRAPRVGGKLNLFEL